MLWEPKILILSPSRRSVFNMADEVQRIASTPTKYKEHYCAICSNISFRGSCIKASEKTLEIDGPTKEETSQRTPFVQGSSPTMSQLLKQTFVDDYLKRLQYSGPVSPDLQTLKTLQRLHRLNIPFENLNNLLQEEYCTTKEDLYKKIVQGHRGGVCYELNTLFAFFLRDIGFSLIIVEATVCIESCWDPFPGHQLSIVSLGDELWIADVGYAECSVMPLHLVEGEIQDDEMTGFFRIRKELDEAGQEFIFVQSTSCTNIVDQSEESNWQYVYKFHLAPRTFDQFKNTRNVMLKDPSSPLNQGLVCTLLRPWGRITVSRYKLIKKYVKDKKITGKEVKMLENQEEVMAVLESEFGVKLQHPETPLKLQG